MMAPSREPGTVLALLTRLQAADPMMTLTTAIAFALVCENEGICQSELAWLLRAGQHTVSRAVDRLSVPDGSGQGLVERVGWSGDGRLRVIRLTARGRDLRDRLDAAVRGAREFGDPRTPPIGRSEPREQATPEELADPEKYAEFEARQDRKLKRAYVVEAERYVAQLRSDIEKGRALGIPADEIAKVEEKVRRIEAMRAELLAADPALLDGAETPSE